jgi:hypothetical protein
MSDAAFVTLRVGEIVGQIVMAALGVTPLRAERAICRVLRARGRRSGDSFMYPPVAALYLSPLEYHRLGPILEVNRPAMERRITERLDPDDPAPLRLHIRVDPGIQRLCVAAPRVRRVVPVRRTDREDPDRTWLDETRKAARACALALLARSGGVPILIPDGGLTLGRGDWGPGRVADRRVSREHARLTPAGRDRLRCRDLGSRNGTWVDRARIPHPVDLYPGQTLRIGNTEFRIVRHQDGGYE